MVRGAAQQAAEDLGADLIGDKHNQGRDEEKPTVREQGSFVFSFYVLTTLLDGLVREKEVV